MTDEFCRKVPTPKKNDDLYRADEPRGFALRVAVSGRKTFVFCYSSGSRERRMTIGDYGTWPIGAARQQAAELRRRVDRGDDPLVERTERREAPDLESLWLWYRDNDLRRKAPATIRDVTAIWEKKILPTLGRHRKLGDLRRDDVQQLVDRVTTKNGQTIANRTHSYLRRPLSLAVSEGWILDNVAKKDISRNPEAQRQRYLSQDEAGRLLKAADEIGTPAAIAIKLMLLTGARRTEVLGMRWSEVDLKSGTWNREPWRTKQRRFHSTPLSSAAVSILTSLQSDKVDTIFVFPGVKPNTHLTEPRRAWSNICRRAGIVECRLHDLRHSFASSVVSSGGTLPVVQALLGQSQAQTAKRYAHLVSDVLRDAADQAANFLIKIPKPLKS